MATKKTSKITDDMRLLVKATVDLAIDLLGSDMKTAVDNTVNRFHCLLRQELNPVRGDYSSLNAMILEHSKDTSNRLGYMKCQLDALREMRDSAMEFKERVRELLNRPATLDNHKLLEMLEYHLNRSANRVHDDSVELLSRARVKLGLVSPATVQDVLDEIDRLCTRATPSMADPTPAEHIFPRLVKLLKLTESATVRDVLDEIIILQQFKTGVRMRMHNTGHTENAPLFKMIESAWAAHVSADSDLDETRLRSESRRFHFSSTKETDEKAGERDLWVRAYIAAFSYRTTPCAASQFADEALAEAKKRWEL